MAILQNPNLAGFLLPHSHILKIRFSLLRVLPLHYVATLMATVGIEPALRDPLSEFTFAVRILSAFAFYELARSKAEMFAPKT